MGKILTVNRYGLIVASMAMSLMVNVAESAVAEKLNAKWPQHIQLVLTATEPLKFDRGNRLPLYLWQAMNPGLLDPETANSLSTSSTPEASG
jgi:hypothetical protein